MMDPEARIAKSNLIHDKLADEPRLTWQSLVRFDRNTVGQNQLHGSALFLQILVQYVNGELHPGDNLEPVSTLTRRTGIDKTEIGWGFRMCKLSGLTAECWDKEYGEYHKLLPVPREKFKYWQLHPDLWEIKPIDTPRTAEQSDSPCYEARRGGSPEAQLKLHQQAGPRGSLSDFATSRAVVRPWLLL